MSYRLLFISMLLVLVAGACMTGAPSSTGSQRRPLGSDWEPTFEPYRIGSKDILEILVWKNTQLSQVVPVKPGGTISLPLLNEVRAVGLTPEKLRETLIERYSEFVSLPEVSVLVVGVGTHSVSVIGDVMAPGQFELEAGATVLEAIALAGGLNQFASGGSIHVLRTRGATTTRLPFDYGDAIDGDPNADIAVESGDLIVVP